MDSSVFKQRIKSLSPSEFEEFIAEIWGAKGWSTTVTSRSDDRGTDIIATRDSGEKELIQVKRYREGNSVGSKEVRNYATLYQQKEDVDSVVIVTSNSFTDPGRELAHDLDVRAIEEIRLYELVDEVDLFEYLSNNSESEISQQEGQTSLPEGYSDALREAATVLTELSDAMNIIKELGEVDDIEYIFAKNDFSSDDFDSILLFHDHWVGVADDAFQIAERLRDLPEESFPSDLRSLIELQIGLLESLGEEISLAIRYKEKLLNTRLEGSPIEIGEHKQLLDMDEVISCNILPPAETADLETLKKKQDQRMDQVTMLIQKTGLLSKKRKEIVDQYNR
ncbi:restriction endonuclease [Halarchaeum salinum]|uniref:Restriction endonuclease type IV Mrr domain-containing protein n=1 Tax=Halarchaeum salinum TaxID=489912 RepID=A0AAV3S6J3_9EURY